MVSLYNRATLSQKKILRAVEGAIKNSCDAHPELIISKKYARSIAKRAAGTLTAQWPDVLAVRLKPSDNGGSDNAASTRRNGPTRVGHSRARPSKLTEAAGALSQLTLSQKHWKKLGALVGKARREGKPEKAEGIIELLKMLRADNV